tara:strand:+ start:269 stop:427 length:159 start_codon:yes stop_codon:yes gene_type:complete
MILKNKVVKERIEEQKRRMRNERLKKQIQDYQEKKYHKDMEERKNMDVEMIK